MNTCCPIVTQIKTIVTPKDLHQFKMFTSPLRITFNNSWLGRDRPLHDKNYETSRKTNPALAYKKELGTLERSVESENIQDTKDDPIKDTGFRHS